MSLSKNSHDHSHEHTPCHSHDHSHGDINESENSHERHSLNLLIHYIEEVGRRNDVLSRLKKASLLCLTFLLVELIGGILCNSLAILSDAAHLLADLASFVVAIAASHIASLPPTSRHTFGFQRLEALAALFSVSSLALISVYLAIEALLRLWPFVKSKIYPESIPSSLDVDAKVMTLVAAMGVAVNIALAFVLKEHHVHLPGMDHGHSHSSHGHGHENEHNHNHVDEESALIPTDESIRCDELGHGEKTSKNINLDAAYLHVLGDLCMSFAVLIAGTIIWWKPEWEIADPLCTLFFSFLVFKSTVGVFFSSISVLLNEVPPDLDWDELYLSISSIAGVSDVHDLHVWSISHGVSAMSVHASAEDVNKALMNIHEICQTKFGISHVTVQLKDLTTAKCITCGKGMLLCHN